MKSKTFILLITTSFISLLLFSQEIDLSGSGWKAWMDTTATWKEDVLYLPSEITDISELPVNEPTGGWNTLRRVGKDVSVPMTVDEYFLELTIKPMKVSAGSGAHLRLPEAGKIRSFY